MIPNEPKKAKKFIKGLRTELREKLVPLQLSSYRAAVELAFEIENDIEEQKIRKGVLTTPTPINQPSPQQYG